MPPSAVTLWTSESPGSRMGTAKALWTVSDAGTGLNGTRRLASWEASVHLWPQTQTHSRPDQTPELSGSLFLPEQSYLPWSTCEKRPFLVSLFPLCPSSHVSVHPKSIRLWHFIGLTSETGVTEAGGSVHVPWYQSVCWGVFHWFYFWVHRKTQPASFHSVLRCRFLGQSVWR